MGDRSCSNGSARGHALRGTLLSYPACISVTKEALCCCRAHHNAAAWSGVQQCDHDTHPRESCHLCAHHTPSSPVISWGWMKRTLLRAHKTHNPTRTQLQTPYITYLRVTLEYVVQKGRVTWKRTNPPCRTGRWDFPVIKRPLDSLDGFSSWSPSGSESNELGYLLGQEVIRNMRNRYNERQFANTGKRNGPKPLHLHTVTSWKAHLLLQTR